jgi:hypothetical protein
MKRLLYPLVLLGCLLIPSLSRAQQQKVFGFHLIQKRKSVRIPFKLHANLVIVPVLINNSDTLQFILDTGVSSTIITDPLVDRFVNKGYTRTIIIDGVGNEESRKANISIGNTLRMGHVRAYEQNLVVLDSDILKLSEFIGAPIHGIFGYELFERFVITIDYRQHELIIRQPERYRYRRWQGERLPLTLENRRPLLSAVQITERGKEKPVQVLLDTGAGHALMLNAYATDITLPDEVVRVQLGVGLGGNVSGHLGRLQKLQVGPFVMKDVLTSFPDSASFGAKVVSASGRQGNIGGELLRRFVVTLNYKEKFVVMKPIRRVLAEPFEHDMSGLDFRAKGEDYNAYYVDRVIEDSPAYYAGIQKDDKLLYINNNPVSNLTLTGINRMLQRKEGREINLVLMRDEKLVFASFQLKRTI